MMALYGITHSISGEPLMRLAKTLKVGIGFPKGPAIHVYIDAAGKWTVETGVGKEAKRVKYGSKAEAKAAYIAGRKVAPERKFPGKFGYFTFQRIGADGSFSPDWECIEAHGPMPSEVGIVFLDNQPLRQQMEWWTASELKCSGDGRDALRRLSAAQNKAEEAEAEKAAKRGEAFFPIIGGCFTGGCPLPRGDKPVCKPHTRLSFQLVNAPTLGSTVTFDSTGFRSASQLFSALQQIRTITGRGDPEQGVVAGVPLTLKLLPYKTSHNGQPSTQFGVTLQLKARDAMSLMRSTLGQADEFRSLAEPALMLEGGEVETPGTGDVLTEAAEATSLEAEFYPVEEQEFDAVQEEFQEEAPPEPPAPPPEPRPVPGVPQPSPLRRKSGGKEPVSAVDSFVPDPPNKKGDW